MKKVFFVTVCLAVSAAANYDLIGLDFVEPPLPKVGRGRGSNINKIEEHDD